MAPRLELHTILLDILGSSHVYFQRPSNTQMSYPAIVYKKSAIRMTHANNLKYFGKTGYMVTVIDSDPDSVVSEKIADLPGSVFDRSYTANNLNHDVYTIYH